MRNYLMSKIPTNIFHLQPQPKLCAKFDKHDINVLLLTANTLFLISRQFLQVFLYFVHHIKEANSIYEETPLLYNIFLVALYY